MKKEIDYKVKRNLIIVVFFILFVTLYKKSIKNTFSNINNYSNLKRIKNDSVTIKKNIILLKKEIKNLDRVVSNNKDYNLVQQNILDYAVNLSDSINIKIISLNNEHIYESNSIIIFSNFLEIEGNYNSILKTIYQFENNFSISKINSIELFTKKLNSSNKKTKLYAKILFQNFKKK